VLQHDVVQHGLLCVAASTNDVEGAAHCHAGTWARVPVVQQMQEVLWTAMLSLERRYHDYMNVNQPH
jgi:hypothetical protein